MNRGQELFIARGKITWSLGSIQAAISNLKHMRDNHPEIDVKALYTELRKVQLELQAKLERNHPPTNSKRKRNGTRPTDEESS